MTNIQAIDLLKGLEQSLDDYCELNDEGKTAFRMAIAALELFGNAEQLPPAQPEPCEDDPRADVYYLAEKIGIHQLYALVVQLRGEPEPCEDAVSRKAAIDAILGQPPEPHYPSWYAEQIKRLPPAQPEIVRCKDCNHFYKDNLNQWCFLGKYGVKENDFCSRAERRTDG